MSAPSVVRLARIGDEPAIFDFFVLAWNDNGFFPISSKKNINAIMKACRHEGVSIGLICDEKGKIEAATGISLSKVRISLSDLSARGEISRCSVTRFNDGKAIEGMLCRIAGTIPPKTPGRKPGS